MNLRLRRGADPVADRAGAVAVLSVAVAAMTTVRAVAPVPLAVGTLVGVVGGALGALVLGARTRPVALRAVVLLAITILTAVAAGGGVRGPAAVPDAVMGALTVPLPAAGLTGLALVPWLLVFPATVLGVASARAARLLPTLGAPLLTAGLGTMFAAPVGTPWFVALAVVVLCGAQVAIRHSHELRRMRPLVGDSIGTGARAPMVRLLLGALPAVLAAGAAIAVRPGPATTDPRRWLPNEPVVVVDENPLSVVSELRDPPTGTPPADTAVVRVSATGVDPGRVRVAVLDEYRGRGWAQAATYSPTGRMLIEDAVRPAADSGEALVTTERLARLPFAALPTAGSPRMIEDDGGSRLRYSSQAGLLYQETAAASVRYRAIAEPTGRPEGRVTVLPATGALSPLTECPSSERVAALSQALTDGVTDPVEKVQRIDSWIKTFRSYEPKDGPGGQNLASVESFIEQPRTEVRRGNLEVYVTTYALLVRCAGVPARVAMGFPSPGVGTREYRANALAAWIEVPTAAHGWVPFDAIPTAEEQARQRDLAASGALNPRSDTPPPTTRPEAIPAREVRSPELAAPSSWQWLAALLLVVSVATLVWWWGWLEPARIVARRRRLADPTEAVMGGWATITDALVDRGVALADHLTPEETVRATVGVVPSVAVQALRPMIRLVDRARFGGGLCTAEEAEAAWLTTRVVIDRLADRRRARLASFLHPVRQWQRRREVRGETHGHVWGRGPVAALVEESEQVGPLRIDGVTLGEPIGTGSAAVVYRGILRVTREAVAVRVVHAELCGSEVDRARFGWEGEAAVLMSDAPHLSAVHAFGYTDDGRAYLVTDYHPAGTLAERIAEDGPLDQDEVFDLGVRLVSGLEVLHRAGMQHGDITPGNVFYDDHARPVLGDLATGWVRAEAGPLIVSASPFVAPEVLARGRASLASDVYSLGLVLLYAATGRMPTAGAHIAREDIEAAFGTTDLLPLFELDPRRRPRSALEAATCLGLERFEALADERPVTEGAGVVIVDD